MPFMPTVRRLVARRPWVQWLVIMVLALGVAASVGDAMAGVEAARRSWESTTTVWVATRDVAPGEPADGEPVEIPLAIRPESAAADPDGAVARQTIGRGEIVTTRDLVDERGSLAPVGWLVAPVRESLPSGATIGERVRVASDGFVIAEAGVVVGFVDDVVLVAVPADVAPLLPAASATTVALLRTP